MTILPGTNTSSYVGKDPVRKDYMFRRDPTNQDNTRFQIGDTWVNSATGAFFVLTQKTLTTANWVVGGTSGGIGVLTVNGLLPTGLGDFGITAGANIVITPGVNSISIASTAGGATSFPANVGTATEAAGVLNIVGGNGISTTGLGNTILVNIAPTVTNSFDVDSGGPAIPVSNRLSMYGRNSSDFTYSGIVTNVGATTDEVYFENRRFTSAFIVDANATVGNRGEYTTITAALTAASAGDTVYVRPGTYNENISLKVGTNLVGLSGPGEGELIILTGTLNADVGAGTSVVQNINGRDGGGVGIELQGGVGSNLLFYDCKFEHQDLVLSFISGSCQFDRCLLVNTLNGGVISTTGIGGGEGSFNNCTFSSTSGNSTIIMGAPTPLTFVNSTISGDDTSIQCSASSISISTSLVEGGILVDNGTVNLSHTTLDTTVQGTTGISLELGSVVNCDFVRINSGTEVPIEVNAASTVSLHHMVIDGNTGGDWINIPLGSSLEYSDISLIGTNQTIGTGGTITPSNWQPYATATTVGVASFAAADFAVSATGEVTSTATGAANSFPSDNGTGTPLAGAMSFVDSTSSDFANSGLETHVGVTTNQLYMENRRFVSAFVVDPSAVVGTRGQYATIGAALAAAVAGDTVYVRPGTYTENIAFGAPGKNLVGLSGPGQGDLVRIAGTINAPAGAGTTTVQNIAGVDSGSARSIELQGGAGSLMKFYDCTFTEAGNCVRWVSGSVEFNRCELTSTGGICFSNDSVGGGTASFEDCSITGALDAFDINVLATLDLKNCTVERTTAGACVADVTASPFTANNCNFIGDWEKNSGPLTLDYCTSTGFLFLTDATVNMSHCSWGYVECEDLVNVTIDHCTLTDAGGNPVINSTAGGGAIWTVTNCTLDSNAVSAVFIEANDTLNYANFVFSGSTNALGGTGIFNVLDWKPYAQSGAGPAPSLGTSRGTSAYDSATFTVTDGFVELIGGPAASTFPVDNGGPGVPVAGGMSFYGATATDFPDPSGIESHVGATTNEIYLEDRRWTSSLIVDADVTVGRRGTFDTITAALAAAVAGQTIYVRPGTYAESFALVDDVSIVGLTSSSSVGVPSAGATVGSVMILGTISSAPTSSASLQNLNINGDVSVAISADQANVIYISDCSISTGNAACIQFNGGEVSMNRCQVTTSLSNAVDYIGTGNLRAFDCRFDAAEQCITSQPGSNASCFLDSCFLVNQNNACIDLQDTINFEIWRTQIVANADIGIATADANGTMQIFFSSITAVPETIDVGVGVEVRAYQNAHIMTGAPAFYITGTGTYSYADDTVNPASSAFIDVGVIVTSWGWKPWAEAGAAPGATVVRGTSAYDSAHFGVIDGYVQLLSTAVATQYVTDAGTVMPVSNSINVFGGPGVTVTGAGDTITVNSVIWSDVGINITVDSDRGSFATAGITLTLPATPTIGEECRFVVATGGSLTIQANAGQTINIGSTPSSVAGTCSSTATGDSIVLVAQSATTWWSIGGPQGNWTLA